MTPPPTLLGHVAAVTGAAISVRQAAGVASGMAIIGGQTYRIGQMGSFVRIPQGYHNLYGIISEVGVHATPGQPQGSHDRGERWMTVQLVGEVVGGSFERGIGQYPSVNDEVHLVTETDLLRIYGSAEDGQVLIGRLSSAEGIPIRIDLDKLVTRHSAVVGSTGSGKSTAVASLLRSIALGNGGKTGATGFPSARVLLLDIHGEYGRALGGVSEVFKVNPSGGERPLHVPFWALDTADLMAFLMGKLDDKPLAQILDRVLSYRVERAQAGAMPGVALTSLTSDSPIPFSLKRLWFDLIDPEVKTWSDQAKSVPALEATGNEDALRAPRYKPHSTTNTPPYMNTVGVLGIRRQLDHLRSRLLDHQFDFLLHPGPWEPGHDGAVEKDLPELLETWLGHPRPVTVLDLSGVPSSVLGRLIGAILKIIYEAIVWGRDKSEGGIRRPQLIVLEEAHRYLSSQFDGSARAVVQRIVKEGRKFGVGAMIVSQRPSEVDETILSQCGTFISLRLSNSADRSKVQALLPDSLSGVVESLPVLRTGEAIIIGEAARLPIRCRITLPAEDARPNSEDPEVARNWSLLRIRESYERVAASWRSQNSRWSSAKIPRQAIVDQSGGTGMDREPVASSNIVSIGYDAGTETLEVEFKDGLYQYYNVPQAVYEAFMQAPSKGAFLHANIRNAFPCSRI